MSAFRDRTGGRPGRVALYVAIVLAIAPTIAVGVLWLRSSSVASVVLMAAIPIAACVLPLLAHTRERAVLLRGIATGLLLAVTAVNLDLWFLFVPSILAMGVATLFAGLGHDWA